MRVIAFVSFFAAALAGCSGIPSVPYQDPAQSESLARIRVITNSDVFGDSVIGSCAPATRHQMAQAGRFGEDGKASINHPQEPVQPPTLGMPPRVGPALSEYIPASRMAEGVYKEIVTEYRVRADVPFQLATRGATIGNYGSTFFSCESQALVFKLEPGKDYEALVGVGRKPGEDGGVVVVCVFRLVEMVSFPGTDLTLPKKLTGTPAPQIHCKN